RRIRPADANRNIAGSLPIIDADGVDRHVLHAQVAGLAVEEQHASGIGECAQLARLADAGRAGEKDFHTAGFVESFVGADDFHGAPLTLPAADAARAKEAANACMSESLARPLRFRAYRAGDCDFARLA